MTTWLTSRQIGDKEGKTRQAVEKQMARHGYSKNKAGRYSYEEYLEAEKAGAEADKRNYSERSEGQSSGGAKPSLNTLHLQRKIKRADIDIAIAEVKLKQCRGELMPVEDYHRMIKHLVNLCVLMCENWTDKVAAVRKDKDLVNLMNQCRDQVQARLSEEMMNASKQSKTSGIYE